MLCLLLAAVAGGCHTAEPVTVYPSFTVAPALAAQAPTQIAVLPVEDGTDDRAAERHLVFLRQEVMRQLVDRLYTPISSQAVDTALRGTGGVGAAEAAGSRSSVLDPTWLRRVVGRAAEDAALALRIDRWDESKLLINRRVYFQFQASLVGKDGQQLWYGTLSGEVKAGGAGAAPRDRDYMARSCAEIAIRQLLLRLPSPH
ncbi:MAG: hypothetical protein KDE27_09025 [Planctomycetes bacterium]|nr:hypothetical protein [Planctomycetota bacterium]